MPPEPTPSPPPGPLPAPSPERPLSSFAIDVPETLLARARSGEGAAFEQIYRWFERPVFNLAMRIGGNRDEATDVLQETMLKVLTRIGDFRGHRDGSGTPFWGWLRQIAVNESLMRLRSQRRHEHAVEPDDESLPDDRQPPPPAAADAAALGRALAQLPAPTRSVLWLYHAEGYTHEEIATLMQRSSSFSKSQLARGTRRLRLLLEPEQAHA